MTLYTFTRTTGGAFSGFLAAKYWNPTGAPGPGDEAVLPQVTKTAVHDSYTVAVTANVTVTSIVTGTGAVLEIGDDHSPSDSFTASDGGVNAGEIAIGGNPISQAICAFTFGGTLENDGLIEGQAANDKIYADNGTLTGGGIVEDVTLENTPSSISFTNSNNRIFTCSLNLNFVNEADGVLEGDQIDGGVVTNSGQIDSGVAFNGSIPPGITDISNATVNGSTGGVILAENGAVIDIAGATIIGGTMQTLGDGSAIWAACNPQGAPALFDGTISTVNNEGTVDVIDLGILDIQGAQNNTGHIAVQSAGDVTQLTVTALDATLTGAGTVSLGGSLSELLGATPASKLTNVDNTISGVGYIGLDSLTLVNQAKGVVEAVGKGNLLVNTGAQTLTNAGLMEAAAGSTLALASQAIDQTGGGTIAALAGGRVDLQATDVIGGTVTSSGTGVVDVNAAGGMLDGETDAVTVAGLVSVVSGESEALEGAIATTGEISVGIGAGNAGLIISAAGATLTGAGAVVLRGFASNTIEGASDSATLTNASRIVGGGALGNGQMTLVNEAAGVINGDVATPLIIDTGANTIVNAGQIVASAGASVVVKSAVDETASTSRLAVAGGTLTLDGAVSGTGGTARINGGLIDFASSYDGNIWFTGTAGTVRLSDSQGYTGGAITGFSTTGGTALDLQDIAYVGGTTKASYSGTASGGVLTVTSGAEVARINFAGDYLASTWTLSAATGGGTMVVDPAHASASAVPRFAQAMAGVGARSGAGAAFTAPGSRVDPALISAPHAARA